MEERRPKPRQQPGRAAGGDKGSRQGTPPAKRTPPPAGAARDRGAQAGRPGAGSDADRPARKVRPAATKRPHEPRAKDGSPGRDRAPEPGFGPWARGGPPGDRPPRRRDRDDDSRPGAPEDRAVRSVAREAIARASKPPERSSLRIVHRDPQAGPDGPVPPRAKRVVKGTGKRRTSPVANGARPVAPRKSAARVEEVLVKAARALDRGYEQDAVRMLRTVRDVNPDVPEVRELLGVALYRLGRWVPAQKELEAYVEMTRSTDQHPVLMDTLRAQGKHTRVQALWEELGAASPAPDIVTEGRIVAAGSLADRGKIVQAIKLLERGPVSPKRPAPHHLRLWYALADLHERAGDLPAARALFRRVSSHDPAFVDVAERLAALS